MRAPRPSARHLERLRVGLALCLAVERNDRLGYGVLVRSLAANELISGLVIATRSLAWAICDCTGESMEELLGRLIDDVVAMELARKEEP